AICSPRRGTSSATLSGSVSPPASSSEWPCWQRISSEMGSGIGTTLGKGSDPVNDGRRSEYFLEKLVAVPSISGDEAEVVQVCRDLMTEVGLTTRLRPCAGVAGAHNVEGSLGSTRP